MPLVRSAVQLFGCRLRASGELARNSCENKYPLVERFAKLFLSLPIFYFKWIANTKEKNKNNTHTLASGYLWICYASAKRNKSQAQVLSSECFRFLSVAHVYMLISGWNQFIVRSYELKSQGSISFASLLLFLLICAATTCNSGETCARESQDFHSHLRDQKCFMDSNLNSID